MVRRPYRNDNYPDTLLCPVPECKNYSVHLHFQEQRKLQGLTDWLADYKLQWDISDKRSKKDNELLELQRKSLIKLEFELETLQQQLSKTHDLLQRGIYTTDTFLVRTSELGKRIQQVKENHTSLQANLHNEVQREENRKNIVPNVERLLETYSILPTVEAKNDLLKEVLEKVEYTKDKSGRLGSLDDFEITLFPKLPSFKK